MAPRRPGRLREVGLLAIYLASDASDYMTVPVIESADRYFHPGLHGAGGRGAGANVLLEFPSVARHTPHMA